MASAAFAVAAPTVVGWRGDGNGRYPTATPPLTWSLQSRAVTSLRAQTHAPAPGDTGTPVECGGVRAWQVLGPVPIPGAGEGDLAPSDTAPTNGAAWREVQTDSAWLDFRALFDTTRATATGVVAYAHTWIYSLDGTPVDLNTMFSNRGRLWLNGKALPPAGDDGSRRRLVLQKGWNRLLLRVSPKLDTSWSQGVIQWYFNAAFCGTGADDGERRNIRWATPMPDLGPGVGSPIVIGERLFVTAEGGVLVCLRAADGQPLWARASTYADLATAGERATNAAAFETLAALASNVTASLKTYIADPQAYASDVKGREARLKDLQKINDEMHRIDRIRYAGQSSSEAGDAAPTPVSDGEHVWAVWGSGVVACFDLDGNRQWTTVLDLKNNEHGYCVSPCLIKGRLIVRSRRSRGAVVLDAATGAVALALPVWKSPSLEVGASPLAAAIGSEDLVVDSFGVIARPSDGHVLWRAFDPPYYNIADYVSPTGEGRKLCSMILGDKGTSKFAFLTLPETVAEPFQMADIKTCQYDVKAFPAWFSYDHCASPLLYEGLAYVVSVDGVLTVMDAVTGSVVYQKMLDLAPLMAHGGSSAGISRAGCSSSPTLGGRHIFIWDDQGNTVVFEPGRTFKPVARNRIDRAHYSYGTASRNECTVSCPVFSGTRIYYRAEETLYCIEGSHP